MNIRFYLIHDIKITLKSIVGMKMLKFCFGKSADDKKA